MGIIVAFSAAKQFTISTLISIALHMAQNAQLYLPPIRQVTRVSKREREWEGEKKSLISVCSSSRILRKKLRARLLTNIACLLWELYYSSMQAPY